MVDPVGIGHLEERVEGAGCHADDEHHHAEDQHIGDDVDPLGHRILGKDAAQLAIIASGEPYAADDAHKPRHFVKEAAQRAAQGKQGDDRKQHDIQYIQVVRKRHRKKGLKVFPVPGAGTANAAIRRITASSCGTRFEPPRSKTRKS